MSNQELSTQPLARGACHSFRRMSRRRMGARRLARVKRDRRAWLGAGFRSKAPSRRGLPAEVRSVLICPFTVHNEWLSAQGGALGTMGAAAFHGAITEEIGAILVPTQLGIQTWIEPPWPDQGPGPGRSPSQGESPCRNRSLSLSCLLAVSGCPGRSSVCSLARHYDRQVKGRAPSGRRSPRGGWPSGFRGEEVGAIEKRS